MLIDLDRNRCKIRHPCHLPYQSGVMYNVSEMHWTCEMLDWRQLAYVVVFMIVGIDCVPCTLIACQCEPNCVGNSGSHE